MKCKSCSVPVLVQSSDWARHLNLLVRRSRLDGEGTTPYRPCIGRWRLNGPARRCGHSILANCEKRELLKLIWHFWTKGFHFWNLSCFLVLLSTCTESSLRHPIGCGDLFDYLMLRCTYGSQTRNLRILNSRLFPWSRATVARIHQVRG
jgi:hypothetical protein